MSTPASATTRASASQPIDVVRSDSERNEFFDELNQVIADRAYQLFEELGGEHGNDLAHWFQAENELAARLPEVKDTKDGYTVTASVPGIAAHQLKVCVQEDRAVISAAQQSSAGGDSGSAREVSTSYYIIEWPEPVDPDSASAQLKNQTVTLTVRKSGGKSEATGASKPSAES
jgi:HSP20 family molecular chaperone IbpA